MAREIEPYNGLENIGVVMLQRTTTKTAEGVSTTKNKLFAQLIPVTGLKQTEPFSLASMMMSTKLF